MATVSVSQTDLVRCKTVMAALKRGSYELEGDEVLAFAQCFGWVSALHDQIKSALEQPIAPPPPEKPAEAAIAEVSAAKKKRTEAAKR